jgi:hypothetical protein
MLSAIPIAQKKRTDTISHGSRRSKRVKYTPICGELVVDCASGIIVR